MKYGYTISNLFVYTSKVDMNKLFEGMWKHDYIMKFIHETEQPQSKTYLGVQTFDIPALTEVLDNLGAKNEKDIRDILCNKNAFKYPDSENIEDIIKAVLDEQEYQKWLFEDAILNSVPYED